jgi:hypothetical protein
VALVVEALTLSGGTEGLAGARAGPDRYVGRPLSQTERFCPSSDSSEEMNLRKAVQVCTVNISDVSRVNLSIGNQPRLNEPSQPLDRELFLFVVVGPSRHCGVAI